MRCPCPDYWITTQTAPTNPKTIGEHLKKRRLEVHLHQKDLARQLGVHIETLKNWETGVGAPMIRYILRVIEFLGYDTEPEPVTLAKRLTYARRRLGLTQDNLAKALKVDSVSIWRWEKGQAKPPVLGLQKLNQLLRVKGVPILL